MNQSIAHSGRYDVHYNKTTGKITEDVCNCGPDSDCQFSQNWYADGKPTIVPIQYRDHLWEDFFEAGVEMGLDYPNAANYAEMRFNELLVSMGVR